MGFFLKDKKYVGYHCNSGSIFTCKELHTSIKVVSYKIL